MSNATQQSQHSGDNRNRRSRGGKNRNSNRNQQDNRRGGERGERRERDDRGDRGQRGGQSNRSEEFRPQSPRPARTYAPVKLSWWQKLLKAIGLYKAPAPPARREHKPDEAKPRGEAGSESRPPKSNIRNARSNEGAPSERSEERSDSRSGDEGAKRGGRRNRDGERPRGGDPSTVESTRVYVGNLSYDVSEQDLQELFKGIGGVRNVEIVYNRSTHRSKGYGFVEMLHKDEAMRAVEVLNDQPFMGRNLTVSGAKSKGQDEREEKEDRPEREPRQVVLAPLPQFDAPVATAEPEIKTIVENVVESPVEAPAAAESVPDLVAKYGFDAPKDKTKEG